MLFSLVVLVIGFGTHVLIWRFRTPQGHTLALLKIFSGVYLLALTLTFLPTFDAIGPSSIQERLHFSLFYLPAALTYTSLYSLIEQDSPSLAIITFVAQAGEQGRRFDEIAALFAQEDIIQQRLVAAEGNGLVRRADEGWLLTEKGRRMAFLFEMAASVFRFERSG